MKDRSVRLTILFTIIVFMNIMLVTSSLNLVLTIVELTYVVWLLFSNQLRDAFFWHTVFSITCLSATNAAGIEFDNTVMFSYSRLKIFGPVGMSYVVSIIILFFSLGKKTKLPSNSLFRKLYKLLLFLLIDGVIIGIMGLFFSDYYPQFFLNFSVYSVMVVINCLCFIQNYDEELLRKVNESAIPLLSGACIASVVAFLFGGVSTTYGGLSGVILVPDLTYFGILLLFLVFLSKEKLLPLIGLLCYVIIMINGVNGKQIIVTIIGALFFVYLFFFSTKSLYAHRIDKRWMYVIPLFLIVGVIYILGSFDVGFLAERKLGEAASMFSGLDDLSTMDTSPYIRVASLLNILNDGMHSPFNLFFGQGYGGYFTDSLHLLYEKVNMYGSTGFPLDAVMKGKLPTGHDTIVVVPLLNGLVGIGALISVVIKYVKKVGTSPFVLVAVFWLLIVYYFNSQLAITGLFLLFAAERDFQIENNYYKRALLKSYKG